MDEVKTLSEMYALIVDTVMASSLDIKESLIKNSMEPMDLANDIFLRYHQGKLYGRCRGFALPIERQTAMVIILNNINAFIQRKTKEERQHAQLVNEE